MGEPEFGPFVYAEAMALTPNGRVADASPLGKGPRRLSDYEREIAHALMRKGKSKRDAIRMARGLLKKAAATGRYGRGKAGPATRAGARASIAQRRDFAYAALSDAALIDLTFNPAEARDEKGRWTSALDRAIAGDTAELEALVAADHGPSRITMPQLSGVPAPGSKADQKYHPAPGQEVDLTDQFMAELQKAGVSVQTEQVPIHDLHPTQDELVGSKVAGLAKFMLHAPKDSPVWEPIFVSADNHVIDGHHRWAARTVRSKIDNTPDETMAVRKIGLNIADALPIATQFMEEWGLPVVGMDDTGTVSRFKSLSNVTADAVAELLLAYDPHEARDSHGRWTDTPGIPHLAEVAKALKPPLKAAPATGNKKFKDEPSYVDVAEAYDWERRDADGSDGQNPMGIMQQGLAQIHARTWDSEVDKHDPDDEQYACSIWEAYQNPDLYQSINAMLRTGKPDPDAALSPAELKRLALAMFDMGGYTTTQPMKVYRALKSSKGDNWAEKLTPGSTFEEDGIVSTTAHDRFSLGWLGLSPTSATGGRTRKPNKSDVMLEIQVPVGTRIIGGNPEFIETMLKPGSKFKIISSEQREATNGTHPLGGSDKPVKPFTYTHVIAELQP